MPTNRFSAEILIHTEVPATVSVDDVVVVVDVLRAFTTAALLLSSGAARVLCVRDEASARALVEELGTTGATVQSIGESRHPPYPVSALPNSPSAVLASDPGTHTFILFTANGTPVLADVPAGATTLVCAAVNITATAAWIAQSGASRIHIIASERSTGEDLACARHLEQLLLHRVVSSVELRRAIIAAGKEHERQWREHVNPEIWALFDADVAWCSAVDSVPVVICARWEALYAAWELARGQDRRTSASANDRRGDPPRHGLQR